MNHLSVYGGHELVFDSEDSADPGAAVSAARSEAPAEAVDVSDLVARMRECMGANTSLNAREICPTFRSFVFGGWSAEKVRRR